LQARDYLRDRGTLAILGLPPHAKLTLPILETMLRGIRVVGCFVGNRQDAVEALELHASGRVGLSIHVWKSGRLAHRQAKLQYKLDKLENVNGCLEQLHQGKVTGRIVLDM
jgi:propanol-preferring alcohol dehydrogenase